MSIFQITAYDKRKVVRIVALVDVVQSLLHIASKSFLIIFMPVPETDQRGYPFITLLLAFYICFYMVHMMLAIILLIALEVEKSDAVTSARNTKVWQNWAIVYLIFLVGNCFSNVLSAQSLLTVFLFGGFGIVEILWRLVGIYNIGIYIDELLEKIPYDTPTLKFFSIRFPSPVEYQHDLNENSEISINS